MFVDLFWVLLIKAGKYNSFEDFITKIGTLGILLGCLSYLIVVVLIYFLSVPNSVELALGYEWSNLLCTLLFTYFPSKPSDFLSSLQFL